MRNLLPCFALSLLLAPTIAWAQAADGGTNPDAADPDAGSGDAGAPDAGGGCGAITLEGECQGSEVVYCNEGVVERIDCATEYDPPAMCGEVDPSYGVDCLLAEGEGCLFLDENDDYVQAFCQGVGAGCVETPNEVICEANVGACTPAQVDRCVGDRLMTDCLINQPYFVDCAQYGGVCREGACREVPAGSFCDPSLILCDDNSECRPSALDPDYFQMYGALCARRRGGRQRRWGHCRRRGQLASREGRLRLPGYRLEGRRMVAGAGVGPPLLWPPASLRSPLAGRYFGRRRRCVDRGLRVDPPRAGPRPSGHHLPARLEAGWQGGQRPQPSLQLQD